jgi:hypothetical protein
MTDPLGYCQLIEDHRHHGPTADYEDAGNIVGGCLLFPRLTTFEIAILDRGLRR